MRDPIAYLTNLTAALSNAEGARGAASIVVESSLSFLGCRTGFVISLKSDPGVADVLAAAGVGAADFHRLGSRISRSSLWRIIGQPKPFILDDVGLDNALSFLSYGAGTRKVMAVPIRSGEEMTGILAVGFAPGTDPPEIGVIKVLDASARLLAMAIKTESRISEALERAAADDAVARLENKHRYDLSQLIGRSSAMRHVADKIRQVAKSNAAILLRGEPGTGKELAAATIHYNSLRSKRPFVKLNCSAYPHTALDAELFGATGSAERSAGGTLFLNEVADIPPHLQARLADILRGRDRRAIDPAQPRSAPPRFVCSSSRDLESLVADGTFSADLFYKLSAFSIFLPSLRERGSDILLLAEHFLDRYGKQYQRDIRRLSTSAIDMLSAYHFPGNVRELENVIESAVLHCEVNVIHGHHLPLSLQTAELTGTETRASLTAAVGAYERDLIQDALKSTRGNIARAAEMLESTERIIGYKILKYRIEPKRYKLR